MKKIILKKGKEKSLLRKHPWIFSGAIKNYGNSLFNGDIVDVYSDKNIWLAKGFFSPESQIRIRVISFNPNEIIDKNFFIKKISDAYNHRLNIIDTNKFNSFRIVNSESDFLPGLIIDKYDKYFVCQFLIAGMENFKKEIIDSVIELFNPKTIYERSDAEIRKKEGLKLHSGLLYGEEPPNFVLINEDKLKFYVDIINGHKTGFYLDQRENRLLVENYTKAKEVLNCFSYTGGFGLAALLGNASKVINADSSANSLNLAGKNYELNNFKKSKYDLIEADVFKLLREYKEQMKIFDVIILDPPKFVDSKFNLEKAARGYKDINMNAFQLLRNGGFLITFSCSGLMPAELFQKIVADAALDAKKKCKIIKFLHQSSDHPIALNFPEGNYLKGFIIQVE